MSTKLSSLPSVDGRGALPPGPPLPPGPRMPAALQAVGWSQRPLPFMEHCQKQYGDIFTLRVRHAGTWVVLCDPEDVKRVFTADPALLGVSMANTLLEPLLGSRSVVLLDEPDHMPRRKVMLRTLHGKSTERYGEMIAEVTRREVQSWPVGKPLELWPRMQAISLEVIMRVVFGAIESDHLQHLRELLGVQTKWVNNPRHLILLALLGPRWVARNREFRATMAPIQAAVLEEVHRRRADGDAAERDDVVAMLEQARYEDGSPLSEEDMRDELITLLTDGPTATLLSWVFERLLRHPDKLERLRAEVRTGEDAYLDAVTKETMRLCPSVPIVLRRLVEPMRLGGYTIPAGTKVAPCIHLIHRREDVYPQPRSFMPERFLQRPAGTYTFIPFGGGTRRCLASTFAVLEMKQVLKTVIGEVEMRAVESHGEHAQRSAIAFSPSQQGLVVLTRRTPTSANTPRLADGGRPTARLSAGWPP
jgi:cytochrome P450 family 135